jgi:esterase/lipase
MTNTCEHKSIPIILLHGLGEKPWKMKPFNMYLKYICGYKNTHVVKYKVDHISYEDALNGLDITLQKILDKDNDSPIIIGCSMGGVMANNLHKTGWNIRKSIMVCSPLHGASIIEKLQNSCFNKIYDKYFRKKAHEFLSSKECDEIPPHPYHTVSVSFPFSTFDGCVFIDETKLDDKNHTHFNWSTHETIFFSPRFYLFIIKILRDL